MTTTLRPTGPIQEGADGAKKRAYDVCDNGRPVGAVEIGTEPGSGGTTGIIRGLRIDEPNRRRGRGTIAGLAAEEVLRGWGCSRLTVEVEPENTAGLRLAAALGHTERSRNMVKDLPRTPPVLPDGVTGRPMTEDEFAQWESTAVMRLCGNPCRARRPGGRGSAQSRDLPPDTSAARSRHGGHVHSCPRR